PRRGDLIHHNRDGATLSFGFAKRNTGYPSHSAIVVGFETRNGVRHVVTIGGNEAIPHGTGTVGKKFFALDANGFLDQSAIRPKLICVVENLLAAGAQAMAPGAFVVRVRTDLKLRGGPGPEFPIIKELLDGTPLNVLEFDENATGRWALVDLEGDRVKDGFVFAKFIE
ncbi:SH3 domain-containing protein, partial [Rhizobium ruizarguesonis]